MYYPMRSVRTRRYKLIHNLAHGLPFPFALDLVQSPTWVGVQKNRAILYGRRPIAQFLRRAEFELYDLSDDPDEIVNLADAPAQQAVKRELISKLKAFQVVTRDPWVHKWKYE
jgi:N-sulfoglucosamine sulfohydrolase